MSSASNVLIVIACYNREKYLEETLRSVQLQTYRHWQVVLVDDASTDASAEVFARFSENDGRFHIVRLPENSGGPAGPRNRAVEYAVEAGLDFSFIAYLDADDLWLPEKLQNQLRLFEAEEALGFVYSRGITYFGESQRKEVRRREVKSLGAFLFFSHISLSSVVLRRSLVESFFPLFDADPQLVAVEDAEAWACLLANGILPKATVEQEVLYRVHESSIGVQGRGTAIRRMIYLYGKILVRYGKPSIAVVLSAMLVKSMKFFVEDLVSCARRAK